MIPAFFSSSSVLCMYLFSPLVFFCSRSFFPRLSAPLAAVVFSSELWCEVPRRACDDVAIM